LIFCHANDGSFAKVLCVPINSWNPTGDRTPPMITLYTSLLPKLQLSAPQCTRIANQMTTCFQLTDLTSSLTVPHPSLSGAPSSTPLPFLTSGPDFGAWPDCWVSVEFLYAPITRKRSGSTTTTCFQQSLKCIFLCSNSYLNILVPPPS